MNDLNELESQMTKEQMLQTSVPKTALPQVAVKTKPEEQIAEEDDIAEEEPRKGMLFCYCFTNCSAVAA